MYPLSRMTSSRSTPRRISTPGLRQKAFEDGLRHMGLPPVQRALNSITLPNFTKEAHHHPSAKGFREHMFDLRGANSARKMTAHITGRLEQKGARPHIRSGAGSGHPHTGSPPENNDIKFLS